MSHKSAKEGARDAYFGARDDMKYYSDADYANWYDSGQRTQSSNSNSSSTYIDRTSSSYDYSVSSSGENFSPTNSAHKYFLFIIWFIVFIALVGLNVLIHFVINSLIFLIASAILAFLIAKLIVMAIKR